MKPWAIVLTSWLCVAACGPPSNDGEGMGDPGDGDGMGPGGGGSDPESFDHHLYDILILDFRSGWWAGSAGQFHQTVLDPLRNIDDDINIEFHHFTVGQDIKCLYPPPPTPAFPS